MSANGLNAAESDGRPIVIVHELQSGVIAHVTPINIPTLKGIQLKAKEKLPYPDKALYQLPEENGFVPGQMTAAEDNPDYVTECQRIDHERDVWADRAIFDYAVRFPKYPSKEAMVTAFRERLAALREIAVLPEDDFEAILFHLVLTWNQPGYNQDKMMIASISEYNRLVHLAIQTVALTPAEVTDGVRFFRPVLSANART